MTTGSWPTSTTSHGWRVYDSHPVHDKVRTDLVRPHIAERATIVFTV